MIDRRKTDWNPERIKAIHDLLPTLSVKKLAKHINVSPPYLRDKIHELGLYHIVEKKMLESQFKKGIIPFCKGKPRNEWMSTEMIEKVSKNQFKKGQKPYNTKEAYSESTRKVKNNTYITIKCPIKNKMVFKHIWLWEQKYGEIPNGYVIRFKDNNRNNCVIENLELAFKEEMTIRNFRSEKYPEELIKEASKICKIQNTINKLKQNKKNEHSK